MKNWVIQVHTGKEKAVKDGLTDFNIRVPTKYMYYRRNGIWGLESRLLLPGYVFGEFEKNPENYYIIRRNPHVMGILGELTGEDAARANWLINGGEAVAPSKLALQKGSISALEGFFGWQGENDLLHLAMG